MTYRFSIGAIFVVTLLFGVISPLSAQTLASHTTSSRRSSSLERKISRLDDEIVQDLKIPVLFGATVANITDTWGDARSNGRTHEGTDIMAPQGTLVVSPTEAVVTSIGYGANGGNYVYTANPGEERFYFAHLNAYKDGLKVGDELEPGDIIGYVGNTGNASGGAPHLHFGIYTKGGAINPYSRLTQEFTLEEKIAVLKDLLKDLIAQLEEVKKNS